jgi:hypothetical protein
LHLKYISKTLSGHGLGTQTKSTTQHILTLDLPELPDVQNSAPSYHGPVNCHVLEPLTSSLPWAGPSAGKPMQRCITPKTHTGSQ